MAVQLFNNNEGLFQLMTARYFMSRMALYHEIAAKDVNILSQVYILLKLDMLKHLKFVTFSEQGKEGRIRFIFKCADLTIDQIFNSLDAICFTFASSLDYEISTDDMYKQVKDQMSKSEYLAISGLGVMNVRESLFKNKITSTKTKHDYIRTIPFDIDTLNDDLPNAN